MSNKKTIQNLIGFITEKYIFSDQDGTELRLHANPNINGYELWLYRVNGGGVSAHLTQHQQIPARYIVIILKMLLYDILDRQDLGFYTVKKRV